MDKATTAVESIGGKTKISYYTDTGVDVTDRIEKGQTMFFTDIQEAEKYAYDNKTYKYDLYNKGGIFAGYGVPK